MKILIPILLLALWFWNCSSREGNLATSVNTTDASDAGERSNLDSDGNGNSSLTESQRIDPDRNLKLGDLKVDFYEDNQHVSSTFYRQGNVFKVIAYNTQTKKQESEVKYFYKESGEFDRAKVSGAYASEDMDLMADKSIRDFIVQYDLLKSKDIRFPLADIVGEEVSDLARVFSVADNYRDFKTEAQVDGDQKLIKLVGFNKKIRFNHSAIAYLIGLSEEVINDTIFIKEYELTLENSFPLEEIYTTGNGKLTKTYSYKGGELIGVVDRFTDLKNRTNTLEKRFEYHELR